MKKIFCFIFVTSTLFFAVGCNNSNSTSFNGETTEVDALITEETTTEEITEPTTEPPPLSVSCDMILATGFDENDNYYEFVGNETENYSGVKVEVGVIKNNEWLIEMTSDMPFINENGEFLNGGGLSDAADDILFIGNECFRYQCYEGKDIKEVYYNVNTQKYYENKGSYYSNLEWTEFLYVGDKYSRERIVDNEEKIFIPVGYYAESVSYIILDTKTMEIYEVNKADIMFDKYAIFYPVSEDMFAVASHDKVRFYDLNGSMVIDLSEYKTNSKQRFIFEDGLCTFRLKNSNNTEYEITIDKTGDVVLSKEIS